jgi:hypothetical protein
VRRRTTAGGDFSGSVSTISVRILLIAAMLALPLTAANVGIFQAFNNSLFAKRFEWAPRQASGNVIFVAIDKHSLDAVGTWPWPRSIYAALLDRLIASGARDIFLDVDFSAFSSKHEDDRLAAALDTGLIDYVAMDVKSSPDGYALATGSDADPAVYDRSIRLLEQSGIPHEFRTTAVGGIHTPADFAAIGQWLSGTERYFIQRFVDSGNLLGEGYTPFSDEEMQELLNEVLPYIPHATIRG